MNKMNKEIMVVPTQKVLKNYFLGAIHKDVRNYKEIIDNNYEWMRREDAETNTAYKQPIPYIVVMNEENKIFAFQRANKKKDYSEKRLFDKWSIGVGGHVDKDTDKENPIQKGMMRELQEEIHFDELKSTSLLGYINYDLDNVGKVHFGLLYLARIKGVAKPKDSEVATSKMMKLNEVEALFAKETVDAEDWSVYTLQLLKHQG